MGSKMPLSIGTRRRSKCVIKKMNEMYIKASKQVMGEQTGKLAVRSKSR